MAEFLTGENEEKEGAMGVLDEEEDEEDDFPTDCQIQLGFIDLEFSNKLFLSKNWKEWDGGVIGGKPVSRFLLFSSILFYPLPLLMSLRFGYIVKSYQHHNSYNAPHVNNITCHFSYR